MNLQRYEELRIHNWDIKFSQSRMSELLSSRL
jgi:hypothetical protein